MRCQNGFFFLYVDGKAYLAVPDERKTLASASQEKQTGRILTV
jgi:hypothetical protein